ncbi:MAG: AraC family transcriptional regulator [Rhodococcus sp.]|nr:AraC family transcriptional regulator [Rhodococcus sp. (in: high G+C Gram-positive bacteria)]
MDGWNAALESIERQLGSDDIDVNALARLVLTNEFQFRRMFSVLSGLTLSDYIRRRRLTVAASVVLEGREAIQDIAVRFGYSSADAFSRAFRAVHGVGPQEARQSGAVLRSQPRLMITLNIEGAEQVDYRLENKGPFALIGRKRRMQIVFEGPNQEMIDFYKEVGHDEIDAIGELANVEPKGTLSVCTDFEEGREDGSSFEFWIAAAVESNPGEVESSGHRLDVLDVPAHTWLVLFTEDTATEAIQQLWVDAYGKWFPSNPYSAVPGPELCVNVYDEEGNDLRTELWLPVQKV